MKFQNNKESFFSSLSKLLDLTDHENNNHTPENEAEGAKCR